MTCEEIIQLIVRTDQALVASGQRVPALTLTALCYCKVASEVGVKLTVLQQCATFFSLAEMVEQIRAGLDPRCSKCFEGIDHKLHDDEVLQ